MVKFGGRLASKLGGMPARMFGGRLEIKRPGGRLRFEKLERDGGFGLNGKEGWGWG